MSLCGHAIYRAAILQPEELKKDLVVLRELSWIPERQVARYSGQLTGSEESRTLTCQAHGLEDLRRVIVYRVCSRPISLCVSLYLSGVCSESASPQTSDTAFFRERSMQYRHITRS